MALGLLVGVLAQRGPAADIHLSSLKIGTDVFTNVTVYQISATDIFVRHERGFGNAKLANLDDPTLRLLGLKTEEKEPDKSSQGTVSAAAAERVKTTLAAVLPSESAMLGTISRTKPTPQLLVGVLAVMLLGYLFCCLVLKKICVNAGSEPGPLIWFPVLQAFPLLRAARIPAWWFVILLIPGLNLLAHVLWSLRIAAACGKGVLVAVLLILPVTGPFAMLYLAFSSGREPGERELKPEDLPGLAGA